MVSVLYLCRSGVAEKRDAKPPLVREVQIVGKPRQGSSSSRRGEGGVGFLVKECLASGVELMRM